MKDIDESSAGISKSFHTRADPRGLTIGKSFNLKGSERENAEDWELPEPVTILKVTSEEVILRSPSRRGVFSLSVNAFAKYYEENIREVQRQDGEPYRAGPIGPYEPDPDEDPELSPVIIDLGMHRSGDLDESFLRMFGGAVKMLLKRMFGEHGSPVIVRGTQSEINSFSNALSREKRYLSAMEEFGLDNPKTHRNKSQLDASIQGFERKTGLKWPFK